MPIRNLSDLRQWAGEAWKDASDADLVSVYAKQANMPLVDVANAVGYDAGSGGMTAKRTTASISNYVGGLQGVGEAVTGAMGLTGAEDYFAEKRRANEVQAQVASGRAQKMGAIESYKDINSVGDFFNYAGGLAVGSAPYAIEAMTGAAEARALMGGTRLALTEARAALEVAEVAKDTRAIAEATQAIKQAERSLNVGQNVGIVAQSYPSSLGDILGNQREQSGKTDLASALPLAGAYAGLNIFEPQAALAKGSAFRNTINLLDRPGGIGGAAARLGATATVQGLKEGASETGQEMLNQAGRMAVDDKAQFFSQDAIERYKESFVGGVVLGGALSGLGGYRRSEGYQAGGDIQQAFTQPQTSGTPITGQTPPAAPPPAGTTVVPPVAPNAPAGGTSALAPGQVAGATTADQTAAPITPPAVSGGTSAIAQASQGQTQAGFAAQQQQAIQDQREKIIDQFGLRGEKDGSGQFFNRPIFGPNINQVADALGPIAAKLDKEDAAVMDAIVQADKLTGGKLVNFKFNADKIPQSVQKGVEAVLSVANKFQIGHVGSVDEAGQILNTLSQSAKGAELEQINAIHQVLTGKDTEGYIASQTAKTAKPKGKSNAQQQQLPEQVPTGLGTVPEQGSASQVDGGLTGLLQPGAVQPVGTGSVAGAAPDQQAGQPSGEGVRPSASVAADNGSNVYAPQVNLTARAPETNELLQQVFKGEPSTTGLVTPVSIGGPVRVAKPKTTGALNETGTTQGAVGGGQASGQSSQTNQPGVDRPVVQRRKRRAIIGAKEYNPGLQYYSTDLSHISSERRVEIIEQLFGAALTPKRGGANVIPAATRGEIARLALNEQFKKEDIAEFTGLGVEAVSKQMQRMGIALKDGKYQVVDPEFAQLLVAKAEAFRSPEFPDGIGINELKGFYSTKYEGEERATGDLAEELETPEPEGDRTKVLAEELYGGESGEGKSMGTIASAGSSQSAVESKKANAFAKIEKLQKQLDEASDSDVEGKANLAKQLAVAWAAYEKNQAKRAKEAVATADKSESETETEGEEDAVQVESADEGDVREPTGGGEEVGKANAEPKKPARTRKAKAESKPAPEAKEEIKTPKEQWDALADKFPQMPPYATLNKDEKIRWDDVAERGVANLAAANTILSTTVVAEPAETVEAKPAEAKEQPKFGVNAEVHEEAPYIKDNGRTLDLIVNGKVTETFELVSQGLWNAFKGRPESQENLVRNNDARKVNEQAQKALSTATFKHKELAPLSRMELGALKAINENNIEELRLYNIGAQNGAVRESIATLIFQALYEPGKPLRKDRLTDMAANNNTRGVATVLKYAPASMLEGVDIPKFGVARKVQNPYSAAELIADIKKFIRADILGNKLIVVDSISDLIRHPDADVRAVAKALGDKGAYGVAVNGKAFLIANRIEQGEGRAKFLHEVGAHLGLENLLPKAVYDKLTAQIDKWASSTSDSTESTLAKAAQARVEAANTPAEDRQAEMLAYFIEEAVQAGIDPTAAGKESAALSDWFRTLWAAFKTAIRRLGFKTEALTAQDIVNLAFGAARLEITGTWHGTAADYRRFSHAYMSSGEGAQAFGWGTYLAQRVGVAVGYWKADVKRKTLSQNNFSFDNESFQEISKRFFKKTYGKEVLTPNESSLRLIIRLIEDYASLGYGDPEFEMYNELGRGAMSDDYKFAQAYRNALRFYENNRTLFKYKPTQVKPEGSLMRVDTSVADNEMIDWDAPIAEQPQLVKDFLAEEQPTKKLKTGEDIYNYLLDKFYKEAGNTGSWKETDKKTIMELKKEVSQYLDDVGIKGHKFYDSLSRSVSPASSITWNGKKYSSDELRDLVRAKRGTPLGEQFILLRRILRNGVASVRAEFEQKVARTVNMLEEVYADSAARYKVKTDPVKDNERAKREAANTYEGMALAWLNANESKISVTQDSRTQNVVIYNDKNIFRVGTETAADKQRMKFGFAGEKGVRNRGMTEKQTTNMVTAKIMDAQGELREDIWYTTGWLRGADNQWRTEFSDRDAKMTLDKVAPGGKVEMNKPYRLGDVLSHLPLYRLYPELADYTISFDPNLPPQHAAYDTANKSILMSGQQPDDVTTLLHEVQHAIQDIEGFGRGGSAEDMDVLNLNAAEKFYKASIFFATKTDAQDVAILNYYRAVQDLHADRSFTTEAKADAAFQNMLKELSVQDKFTEKDVQQIMYLLISGEVEARDVEARREYNNELRRQVVPGEGEGLPYDTQLVFDKNTGTYKSIGKTLDARAQEQVEKLPAKWQPAARTVTTTLLHTIKKSALASMITEDVINAASKYMKSAQDYLAAQYARQATRLQHELKIDKILQQFDKLPENLKGTSKGSVNEYIHDSTSKGLWGYYPDARLVGTSMAQIDPEFKRRFNAFPKAAQDLIKSVFEQGHDSLAAKQKAVADAIDREYADRIAAVQGDAELTKKFEKEKNLRLAREAKLLGLDSSKPYAYLGRYGDYVVVGKSAEYKFHEEQAKSGPVVKGEYLYGADSRKWLEDNRSNPAHYVVQFAETLGEADQIASQLNATGNYDIAESFEKEPYSTQGGELFTAVSRLRNLYDRESEGADPQAAAAISNLLGDLYLHTVAEASARKSEFQRLNISGADKDMMRNLATRGRADAHFLAALQHNDAISDSLSSMRKERDRNRREAGPYFNELLQRHANSMEYKTPGGLSTALQRMSTVWYLSTNPAFYLQQILQTGAISLPYMAGRLGYFRSARAIKRAYGDMATLVKGVGLTDHIDFAQAPVDVRDMLKTLVGMGKIDIGIDYEARARAGETGVVASVMNKLQGVNNRIETINRATAAIAAYRGYLERYKNNDTAAATKYAADVVSNTHGSYDAFNTPRIMSGPAGKVLLQFKRFQIIQISMLAKLLNTAFKGASAQERTVARHSLAFITGQMAVLGGMMAVPFAQQAASILSKIFGDPDEPDDWEYKLRRMVDDKAIADLLISGVPGALGVDVSSKIGLGNVFSILPYTDVDLASRSGAEKVLVGLMGASANLGLKFADALGLMAQGQYYKGLEQMLPNGVANLMKGARFAAEGITMRNGDVVLKPDEISMLDAAFQAVGLPTNTITDRQFTQKVVKEFDKYYTQRTTEVKGDYVEASRKGDSAAMADAREEWIKLQESRVANGYKRQPYSELYRAPMEANKRARATAGGVEFGKSNRRFVESLSTI
jgi:hypothetical protein